MPRAAIPTGGKFDDFRTDALMMQRMAIQTAVTTEAVLLG
jgi:hypothetical protein